MGTEEERLSAIYRLYGSVIYSRCRRMLNNDAAAEDATQETFVRVYRHLAKAPPTEEALAWIYRIATNYCLNELRNERTRAQPVDVLPELPASNGGEERLGNRDLASRLIAQAPERVRSVAWLYHVDGFGQDEIARVLGLSRRTVVYRLASFLKNARRLYGRSAA